ncbi:MAG: antibiotic ABC transporter permease [Sphingobacteriales bacterium 50-39]|mgnify:CR=1 FL=1|nr:ABC transporter permease [Sphingobacteriales bacterium]OJW59925.1 MAG: antibiotic ABC transporter permease [Sphingobacteriales bacterium 50-39]
MWKNYLKTAVRALMRYRVYSFINIVGLSLGLACTMLIILYVRDEISYDAFHTKGSQIYRVDRQVVRPDGSIDNSGYTGYFQGPRFAAQVPEVQGFVRLEQGQVNIRTGSDIRSQFISLVDSNFFSVFSFPLSQGDPATCLQSPEGVVITEDIARRQFGTTHALGKILLSEDMGKMVPHTVTGVAKNCPQNSSIKFEVLMPLVVSPKDAGDNMNWFQFFLSTFMVLRPDADPKVVEAKMKKAFETDAGESIKMIQQTYKIKELGISFFLQPLADIHLSRSVSANDGLSDAGNPSSSYILSGIALFILLIACINFVNLTVARSMKRAKEIGIRKVIGGNRRQLIVQFLGESSLLCCASFILALLLVSAALPSFNGVSGKALSLSYLADGRLIAGYVALFLLTSLLAGFYPALVLSGYNPVKTLYGRVVLSGKNHFQRSLVILQFALASFLIMVTLTIFYQYRYLTSQPLGYDDANLVEVGKTNLSRSEAGLFKTALSANPNILGVTLRNSGYSGTTVKVNGNGKNEVTMTYETVDPGYLSLLKIPLVAGRNFSPDFPADSTRSVLVNECFVRDAGWKDPIGQTVEYIDSKEKYTVIGVVKDYHFRPLTEKIEPQLFTMRPGNDYGLFYIKIRPGSETSSLAAIAAAYKQLFPLSAYSYSFKHDDNRKNYEAEQKWTRILFFGAILTIFVSCIGLFALSVLSGEQRTKEIGIRKVLGASVTTIAAALSGDFLRLVLLALVIAIPVAWFTANKWLQAYPYRIALSWGLFVCAGLLVILIALVTVGYQAIKAAVANPVKNLRSE